MKTKTTSPGVTGGDVVLGRRAMLLGAASLAACSNAPPVATPTASVGATSTSPSAAPREKAPDWVVGVVATITGLDAPMSVPLLDGMRIALEEVNAAPPKGRALLLRYEDDKSRLDKVLDATTTLAEDPEVVAMVGGLSSAFARVAASVALLKKAPLLVSAATHPSVTEGNDWAFRACFTDPAQGRMAADWAVKTAKKARIGILAQEGDEYSQLLSSAFRARVGELGGLVVSDQTFREADRSLGTYVDALRAQKVDLVYSPVFYASMIRVADAAKKRGFGTELFLGSDAWSVPELYPHIEGAAFTEHFVDDVPGAKASAFVAAYRARHDEPPSNLAALGYDSVLLLADALSRATEDTRDGVRAALEATKDFVGASGRVRFSPKHETEKNVLVARVRDGMPHFEAAIGPFADVAADAKKG